MEILEVDEHKESELYRKGRKRHESHCVFLVLTR